MSISKENERVLELNWSEWNEAVHSLKKARKGSIVLPVKNKYLLTYLKHRLGEHKLQRFLDGENLMDLLDENT